MMKIFFPRHISKGIFGMKVSLGPVSVSVVQLILLAVGLGLTLAIWQNLYKSGTNQAVAFLVALPIFLICVFIAFFKRSELTLVPFIAKMIRTHFLDATQKFQVNRDRPDPKAVILAKFRRTDHDKVITQKDLILNEESLEKLRPITEEQE